VKKCGTAGQEKDDNVIWRMRFAGWISKAARTRAHTRGLSNTYY
jgi:hypothetical protein